MNIKRSIHIAAAVFAVTAGLASPAAAFEPVGGLSNGAPRPVVKWDHAAWKKCYSLTYAQWREDGASPSTAQSAADLTCGTQP